MIMKNGKDEGTKPPETPGTEAKKDDEKKPDGETPKTDEKKDEKTEDKK